MVGGDNIENSARAGENVLSNLHVVGRSMEVRCRGREMTGQAKPRISPILLVAYQQDRRNSPLGISRYFVSQVPAKCRKWPKMSHFDPFGVKSGHVW